MLSRLLCTDHGSSQLRGCKRLLTPRTERRITAAEGRDSNTHTSSAGTGTPPRAGSGVGRAGTGTPRERHHVRLPPQTPRALRRSGRSWPGWRGPARRSPPAAPPRRHTPACGTPRGKSGRLALFGPGPIATLSRVPPRSHPIPHRPVALTHAAVPPPSRRCSSQTSRHFRVHRSKRSATSGCAPRSAPPVGARSPAKGAGLGGQFKCPYPQGIADIPNACCPQPCCASAPVSAGTKYGKPVKE